MAGGRVGLGEEREPVRAVQRVLRNGQQLEGAARIADGILKRRPRWSEVIARFDVHCLLVGSCFTSRAATDQAASARRRAVTVSPAAWAIVLFAYHRAAESSIARSIDRRGKESVPRDGVEHGRQRAGFG